MSQPKPTLAASRQRFALLKPYARRMSLGLLAMLVAIVIQLSFPAAIASFIDNSMQQTDTLWLSQTALLMLLGFIVFCLATSLRYYLFESSGALIVTDIRRRLFSAIIARDTGFFDKHKVGELTSNLSNDIEMLKMTLSMGLAVGLRSLLTCIGGAVMLLSLSPQLSLLMLFVLPISIQLAKWLGSKARGQSKTLQQSIAATTQMAQENMTNIRLVHTFNQQRKTKNNYRDSTAQVLQNSLKNAHLFAVFQGLSTFITYSFILLTLWIGGQLVKTGGLSIGELTSFVIYAAMVAASASGVSGFWGEWMRSFGATERVFELLNYPAKTPSASHKTDECAAIIGQISFEQIDFSYPGRKNETALKAFDLSIKAGEKVAIVGPSGAGKSTIAKLLLGFYQPCSGKLKFDGIDATQYPLQSIREAIAIVEQEPVLFCGTILDNIGYAFDDPSKHRQAIEKAAELANAHQFVSDFEKGYETLVGERGVQLSGGQKQRIAIARALVRNPKILILDEATSALDTQSEALVQQALERIMQGRTTIMIAHRYSTIAKADKLVVMDNGQIVQYGSHQQLQNSQDSLYHKLMSNQLQDNTATNDSNRAVSA